MSERSTEIRRALGTGERVEPERITINRMLKNTKVKLSGAVGLAVAIIAIQATPLLAVPIYSSGDFKDPSADPLAPTDLSHAWYGGFDFTGANVLAQSFSLGSAAQLQSVNLWTYDTIDDGTGTLNQIQYAIYAGTQLTGAPVSAGLGMITSSAPMDGHRIYDSAAPRHEGLWVIQSSFNLVAPVSLVAGTTYWLALSAVTNPFGANNIAKWADCSPVGGSYLVQNGLGWDSINGGRAFELNGEAGPPAIGVNVPDTGTTLPLLGMAMAGVGSLSRVLRKRAERIAE